MAKDYVELTAEDFGEAPAAPKGEVSAAAPSGTTKVAAPKVPNPNPKDIGPDMARRALAGAGWALTNKWHGLTGQPEAPSGGLDEDFAGKFGAMVPDVVGSMLAPARIIPQALYGAATRAIEPAPNALERGVAGLKGAAEFGGGQALASGVVRGANALAGKLTREGEAAAAAKTAGLNLTAGDISKNKLFQLAEEKSFRSPSRNQADEIAAIMNTEGGDPITVAIKTAYENAQRKVSNAASRLDELVSTGNLPGVTPRKTYDAIRQIAKRSPDTINNVRDPELRAVIDAIVEYPAGRIPKNMGFAELDELRKTLGPIMAKVEAQSKSGASNVTVADANRWKQLYKGIMEDIESWGSRSATEDALKAHKELSSTFKNEVLPLREHPVAGKVINDGYSRPEDLLRDLTSTRNKSVINELYGRLDTAGKNAFDALRMATRGSKEFVRGEPAAMWSRPLTVTAGLTSPAWAPGLASSAPWLIGALAAEQALVHGANTPIGRAIVSGAPEVFRSPMANTATYAGLRASLPTAAKGALEQLKGRD